MRRPPRKRKPPAAKGAAAGAAAPKAVAPPAPVGLPQRPLTLLHRLRDAWKAAAATMDELGAVTFIIGLMALVGFLLLGAQQGADLTHTIVEEGVTSGHFYLQVAMLVLASAWMGGQAWFWSRRIIVDNCGGDRDKWKAPFLLTWLPRALGVAPFLLAALAIAFDDEGGGVLAVVLTLLAAGVGVLLWARVELIAWAQARYPTHFTVGRLTRFSDRVALGSLPVALVALVWVMLDPVRPAQTLGAVSVVYVGVGMIIPVMAWAIHNAKRLRLPVVSSLLVLSVVWSCSGQQLGDTHGVGRRALGASWDFGAGKEVRPTFEDAFRAWYDQAPTGADGRKPMIVVAAAGGASRAGYWAANVLGELQQRSGGQFSKSVFAISSVSGGSVGATAFVSQLYDTPVPPRGFADAVRTAAGGDYLSPALAGLLFPDLAQTILPRGQLPSGAEIGLPDRAEALEKAFEASWDDHCVTHDPKGKAVAVCQDRDLWRKGYLSMWRAGSWTVPLLFINGAREEDGRRILTAPVQVRPDLFPDAADFYELTDHRDLPVSSAIHNGARFPVVSPGGTLLSGDGTPHGHILDGGYFENSGVTTAGDIARGAMRFAAANPARYPTPIRPILIELNNDTGADLLSLDLFRGSKTPPYAKLIPSKSKYFLSDVLGPVAGLSSGRGGRATPVAIAVSQTPGLEYKLVHLCNTDADGRPDPRRKAPMDWVLSRDAKDIEERAYDAPVCKNECPLNDIMDAVRPTPATAATKKACAPAAAR